MSQSDYEKSQEREIEKWKSEEPSVISKTFGVILSPLTWAVNKVIPEAAIKSAIDLSSSAAEWLTDTSDVIRDAKVGSVAELRGKDLKLSDDLANEVHNWAIGFATAEGAGTGFAGLPGLAADIPAIIVQALRVCHKIGICYGYEAKSKEDRDFILGIMSASSANTMEEKVSALAVLRSIENIIAKQTWKKIAQTASTNTASREAMVMLFKNLAKQLGVNLTKRKALQAIPFVGAAVGGSVNGWYLKEVGWAARRMFQERWLSDRRLLISRV